MHDDSGNIDISHSPSNCHYVKYSYGKVCKGLRGLKIYQCNCPVIKDLTDGKFEFVQDNLIGSYNKDDSSEHLNHAISSSLPNIKPGVNLLKSD